MTFYFGNANPILCRVQHPQNQKLGLQRHPWSFWEDEVLLPIHDSLADFFGVFVAEQGIPEQALEHDDSNAPNVHPVVVGFLSQYLRSNVIRSSNFGEVSLAGNDFFVAVVLGGVAPLEVPDLGLGRFELNRSLGTYLLRPKSVSLRWPSRSMRMLSGLMSLWM